MSKKTFLWVKGMEYKGSGADPDDSGRALKSFVK